MLQDLHRKQVHVSSVPRHCVPSEFQKYQQHMRDGTETRSRLDVVTSALLYFYTQVSRAEVTTSRCDRAVYEQVADKTTRRQQLADKTHRQFYPFE